MFLKLLPHLSGANELTWHSNSFYMTWLQPGGILQKIACSQAEQDQGWVNDWLVRKKITLRLKEKPNKKSTSVSHNEVKHMYMYLPVYIPVSFFIKKIMSDMFSVSNRCLAQYFQYITCIDNISFDILKIVASMCDRIFVVKIADIRLVHILVSLTHCGLVMPCGTIDLGQHWLR